MKQGTPTMGGFLILLAIAGSTLLWADLANPYIWIVLFVTGGFGAVGFVDDYRKLTKRSSKGLSGRSRLAIELAIGAAATLAVILVTHRPLGTELAVPFFKSILPDLGWSFVVFGALVIAGSAKLFASSPLKQYLVPIYDAVQKAPYFQYSWDQALGPTKATPMLDNLANVFELTETPTAFAAAMNPYQK